MTLVKTFTLRLDQQTMQFDDAVFSQFVQEHEVLSMKTQFFYFQEEPMWSVMITYRNQYTPSAVVQTVQTVHTSNRYETPRKGENPPKPKMTEKQLEVYERLRLWRNETARVHGYPPANLLDNRQLKEIVEMNPKSIHQLTKIYGIGTYKASTYGREIIELLSVLDTHVDIVEVSSTPEDTKVVLHPVVDMVEDTEQSDVDHTNMITTGNKHG